MHRQEVGGAHQLLQRHEVDAHLPRPVAGHVRVVGNQPHTERERALGDEGTDAAEADDAERLAVELDALPSRPLPLAGLQRGVGLGDVAGLGEQQGDGLLGRREDVRLRRVDDHHAAPRGGCDVDVVDTDARSADDDQILGRVQHRLGDLRRRADDQRLGTPNGVQQLIWRQSQPDVDLIITDGQDKTEKQVADCENLVVQQVNVLLVSPKESAGLTGVVEVVVAQRVGQAHVARRPEGLARDDGDTRLFQDDLGQVDRRRRPPRAELASERSLEGREGVEGTVGLDARHAGDGTQQLEHALPSTVERNPHLLGGVHRPGEARQGGSLGDVVDIRRRVRLEVRRGGDHVGGTDHPPHTPARHRIRLRYAVDDDAAFGQFGDPGHDRMELDVAVHEQLVDLVSDDPQVVVRGPATDGLDLVAAMDGTRGVLRRGEQQDLGARRAGRLQLVDRHAEATRFVGRDGNGQTAGQPDRLRIRHPVRPGEQHLVAGVEQGRERVVQGLLGTVGDEHLRSHHRHAEVRRRLVGDRCAQLGQPGRRRVVMEARDSARLFRRFHDVGRRRVVGLARAEADDVLARCLQRLGPRIDRECRRLLYRADPL